PVVPPTIHQSSEAESHHPDSSHPSIEMVEKTESMQRIPEGKTIPEAPVDNDNFSDLSSELSAGVVDRGEAVRTPSGPRFVDSPEVTISGPVGSSHPTTHP